MSTDTENIVQAAPHAVSAALSCAVLAAFALGCGANEVEGQGQFSRPIAIASDPAAPLPRVAWMPGPSCPGPVGGCNSFCSDVPDNCQESACLPLLIDSGTPLSVLPSSDGSSSFGRQCVELRAAGGLLDAAPSSTALDAATASFRLLNAPIIQAPGSDVAGWTWEAGDELDSIQIGGVIGGNVLRDFALELRHLDGETPSLAFFGEYPGSEADLGDQGRAYLRLQFPGRLLGRLVDDRCDLGLGLDCELSNFTLDQNSQTLLFESTRALLDACVAPPPCAVSWQNNRCALTSGGETPTACQADELGANATLVVATGIPGLVLFGDSALQLIGPTAQLPSCAALDSSSTAPACFESDAGHLSLPGWPPLDNLARVRVRAVGLLQGVDQASGDAPCQRLRERLEGLEQQCEGFAAEGRPVRPNAQPGLSVGNSALVIGEVSLDPKATAPDASLWIPTLIVPETAPPVISLRREIVPEGAQPDGFIGSALLRDTETVLDYTESIESPGVRVRCLDPGGQCLALPSCGADNDELVEFDNGSAAGRTSCCFGLPTALISEVVLAGLGKEPPRIEDACCAALPRAAIEDLQSIGLGMCSGVDAP